MNEQVLALRLRVNTDGSMSVIPQTTRNIDQLSNATDRASRSAATSQRSLSNLATQTLDLGGAARTAAAGLSAFAAFEATKGMIAYADSIQLAESRIRVSTQSIDDYNLANKALVDISLRTHSELSANQLLFARTNQSVEAMGGSMKNTLAFNELLAKGLKLSGAAASETSSIVRQLSQSLASGQLRGDELNSVAENGFRVAQAIRDGLGITMGEMRKQAEAGLLTSDRVFSALLSQAGKLDEEYKNIPIVTGMAITNLTTGFGQWLNSANSTSHATNNLAKSIDFLANNINPVMDTLVMLGEVAVSSLAVKGVNSFVAYGQAQLQARSASQANAVQLAQETALLTAHTEALALDGVVNAQRTLAQSQAALTRAQGFEANTLAIRNQIAAELSLANAEISQAEAAVQATAQTHAQRAAQIALTEAELARGASLTEMAALGRQQAALSAQLARLQTQQAAASDNLAKKEAALAAVQVKGAAAQAKASAALMASQAQVANIQASKNSISAMQASMAMEMQLANAQIRMTQATLAGTQSLAHRQLAEENLARAEQRRSAAMTELAVLGRYRASVENELSAAQAKQAMAADALGSKQIAIAHAEALAMDKVFAAKAKIATLDASVINLGQTQAAIVAARAQANATLQQANAEMDLQRSRLVGSSTAAQRQAAENALTAAIERQELALADLHAMDVEMARVSGLVARAEAEQTAATEALTAAQAEQATILAGLAAAQTAQLTGWAAVRAGMLALVNPLNLLNAGFGGLIGWEVGSWLNNFNVVANTATKVMGLLAHIAEDLRHPLEAPKLRINALVGDLFSVDEAYKRNSQAIDDNVNGTIEWRDKLEKAGLSADDYKDVIISLKTPQQHFNEDQAKAKTLLDKGIISADQFNEKIKQMKERLDNASASSMSKFQQEMAKIQDAIDKANLSEEEYQRKHTNQDYGITAADAAFTTGIANANKAFEQQKQAIEASSKITSGLLPLLNNTKIEQTAQDAQMAAAILAHENTLSRLREQHDKAVADGNAVNSAYAEQRKAEEAKKQREDALKADKKQDNKDEKEGIKLLEAAHKSAYETQIKGIEQLAQAKLALNALDAKQVEFDYQQNNIGLKNYLAERERLIRDATAAQVASYEKQKQAAMGSANSINDIHTVEIAPENADYFEKLLQKFSGDLTKATEAYKKAFGDLSVLPRDQIKSSQDVIDLNDKISEAYRNQEAALSDLNRTAITETQAYTRTVDDLRVKYLEMTGTARDAFLARQALESRDMLKKANANGDTATVQLVNDTNNAALLKRDTDAARAYHERLLAINQSTKELGLTSSEAFDIINKGAGGLSTAFNSLVKALDDVNQSIIKNGLDQQAIMADNSLSNEELAGLMSANAKQAIKLDQQKTSVSLTGLRQVSTATGDMFAENSAARQGFHDLSMALGGIELAYNLYTNAETIASNGTAMISNIATAATKIWSQLGIYAPIGLAIMAASLAAYGLGAFGGSSIAEPPKASPDTGTVLGDSTAQSQSVGNIVKTLQDIHASEYPELRGINSGITNLQAALAGSITTLFRAGGLNVSNEGFNLKAASGGLLGMFGDGYTTVDQRGIKTQGESIGGLISGAILDAVQYNVIKHREWDLFSDSTSYETVFNKLDNKVVKSLSQVFQSVGQVSLGLAEQLGGDLSAQVKAYVIPSLKVDLTGLNGDDASKKLNAVISTALDTMATDVFGKVVGDYQQLGEGMLETATRIVAEVAVVKDALAQSGMTMPRDAIAVADALAQAAGGLKEFQSQFADYYDKFYSDAEKQARLQGNLIGQLQGVYLGLPDTRKGYRDLVEALDLSNAADRERYSLLIKLSSAADTYYSSLEKSLSTYEDAVKSAYDTAAGLLKDQVTTYQGFVDSFKTLSRQLLGASQSPQANYSSARADFYKLQNTLNTGTDAEKQAALGQLSSVTQAFMDASKGYYASGLGYVKDSASAQALLAKEIDYSKGKADMAQNQLDRLTEQVTALGVLNQSVLSVKDAVDALNVAMTDLQKAKDAQATIAAENANKAKFLSQEGARKSAYETPIANTAAKVGAIAQKQESRLGWDAGASKYRFSAESNINSGTGAVTSNEIYAGKSQGVTDQLKNGNFKQVREQFGAIGNMLQNIIGGVLPETFLKIESAGSNYLNDAYAQYTFNGATRKVSGDDIDPLVRLFANDAADYLADHIGNPSWASQIKAVGFSSLQSGFSELSSLMAHLKHPFKDNTYNPLKKYATGGIANTASIFGEAGPEAAVPLPDGRTIPVTFINPAPIAMGLPDWLNVASNRKAAGVQPENPSNTAVVEQLKKSVAVLEKCEKLLTEANQHGAAAVRVAQAGHGGVIKVVKGQTDEIEKGNRKARQKADA